MAKQEVHGVFFRDPISGSWVAMCLEYDGIVTQGDSPDHAAEMLIEALELTLQEPADFAEFEDTFQPVDGTPEIRKMTIDVPALLHA